MKNLLNWVTGLLVVLLAATALNAENINSGRNDGEKMSATFYKYDVDRDGFISKEEAAKMKLRGRSFGDIDIDRDARLSANEFEQYYLVAGADDLDEKSDRSMRQAVVDAWLTAKVKSALLADEQVKGLQVNVDTLKGIVTLRGQAENSTQISQASKVASEVKGVQSVNNQLAISGQAERVERTATNNLGEVKEFANDSAITAKVKAALIADEQIKGLKLNVETDKGVVTLKGNVSNSSQIARAGRITSNVEGVTSVKNDLTVKK